jgi:peptidoglycan/xylan/chitin deacetylase (PgdA/CDA1 family)
MVWLVLGLLGAGALAVALWALRERSGPRAYVLLYHRIVSDAQFSGLRGTERIFSIAQSRFAEHLAALEASGRPIVPLADVLEFARGRRSLSDGSVAISFDDGCESVFSAAFPLLSARGWVGAVFVTADPAAWVFRLPSNPQPRLTDDALRALRGAAWMVGTHGVHHAPPSALGERGLAHDLTHSAALLSEFVSQPVQHAVPGNFLASYYARAATEAGVAAVWTSRPEGVRPGADCFALPRINIEGTTTALELLAALRPYGIARRRLLYVFKRAPALVLGPSLWLPLRRILFASPLARYFDTRGLLWLVAAAALVALGVALAWR